MSSKCCVNVLITIQLQIIIINNNITKIIYRPNKSLGQNTPQLSAIDENQKLKNIAIINVCSLREI